MFAQTSQRDLTVEKDITPAVTKQLPSANKRWALVIGVDKYADHQISPLMGATNDASSVADALVRYAGFPREQVILLSTTQPEERQPTRSNIISRLATLSHLVPKDGMFLFSFAGHGIERNNQAFLMPMDARMSDDVRVLEATGIGVNMVKDWIEEMKVQQVAMFLDACRNDPSAGRSAGAGNPLSEGFRKAFSFESRNRSVVAYAILYATAVGQRAYEYAEKRQGYFSWAIVEGLKGGAANQNGEVTLGALEQYVQSKVPEKIRIDLGPDKEQKPFAEIRGYKASELVLAKVDAKKLANASSMPVDPRIVQMEEWDQIKDTKDPAQLEDFVGRYPDGLFAATAIDRIEQLRWEAASKSKDPSVIEAFRSRYPNGRHAEEASRALIALRPPAPVTAPAVAAAPQAQAPSEGIADLMKRYIGAYNGRDVDQLKAIWPTLAKKDQQTIHQSFKAARAIHLELDPVAPPQVNGDTALFTCRRTLQMTDDRGGQQRVADTMTFRLRKQNASWVIEALQ